MRADPRSRPGALPDRRRRYRSALYDEPRGRDLTVQPRTRCVRDRGSSRRRWRATCPSWPCAWNASAERRLRRTSDSRHRDGAQGRRRHKPAIERFEAAHEVEFLPDTRIRAILGRERAAVNSTTSGGARAGRRPGCVGALSAGSDRGGYRSAGASFRSRVQWHPEEFWDRHPEFCSALRGMGEGMLRALSLVIALGLTLGATAHAGEQIAWEPSISAALSKGAS